MIVGRENEREQIARLLDQARAGHGGALILRGDAGIGKSTLLEAVAEAADGFQVVRARGVESESELPFAALDELLRPVAGLLEELPAPQCKALKAALALEEADGVDRFAVCAAALGLLALAAEQQPVLCVIDDAHWLDHESAEALAFAARRVEREGILILFAMRDADPGFTASGIPDLRLAGLSCEEARGLVAEHAPELVPAEVERLIALSGGNPLALIEFGLVLAQEGRAASLPAELPPVGEAVQRTFLERSSRLSQRTQRALLLVAASERAEPDALWAALEAERVAGSIDEAELAGLLVRRPQLGFSHPLARSAIYQSAAPSKRRSAHRALAKAVRAPDRRTWHLAAAATGRDEGVAAALEETAAEARKRAGVSAQAAALERAAQLTPDEGARARRLFEAGLAAEAAGRFERAEALLAEASDLTTDAGLHAEIVARRSYLLFDRGQFELALEFAAEEAGQASPAMAAHILTASGAVHALVHRLTIPTALAMAERAAELAGPDAREDPHLCHMLAWTLELSGRSHEALELARAGATQADPDTIVAIDLTGPFIFLEDYEPARELLESIVKRARDAQAFGNLAYALDVLSRLELMLGRLTAAYAASLESIQLTKTLGNDVALASALAWLALVEAGLGRSDDARAHGATSLQVTQSRGDRFNEVRARGALGHDALARGEVAAAVEWLEPAAEMLAEGGVRLPNRFPLEGDLIEACVRLGKRADARTRLAHLLENAELTESRWGRTVGARCQALLVDDADAEEAFESALELHEPDVNEFERARTQLAYGERLRRIRRRRAARDQLRAALETLERLGARPWAERARAELRATGEHLRRRGPRAHEQLTPQQLQVALAASEGLTNKEIGARLFLSPKTVDFHLGQAYRKLGVRSRGELIKLFAEQAAPVERLYG